MALAHGVFHVPRHHRGRPGKGAGGDGSIASARGQTAASRRSSCPTLHTVADASEETDYELIDVGGGARLERFGSRVVDRPHPARSARAARRTRGWPRTFASSEIAAGRARRHRPGPWTIVGRRGDLELRPTDAGQVGAFPGARRDAAVAASSQAARGTVLNLFAYTGLRTLASPRRGPRSPTSTRRDRRSPGRGATPNCPALGDRPVRWIVDDARDVRRARGAARSPLRRGRPRSAVVRPRDRRPRLATR